jgi:membrane fusion protein (multidrug efflux system)
VRAYLLALGLLLALLGGIALLYQQMRDPASSGGYSPPPLAIAAATATSGPWRRRIEAVGTVRAARGILINAETAGDISRLHVVSGQQVDAGAPLMDIDERLEVATRQRLLANLELAELLYQRDLSLIEQRSIPQTQLDRSRADLRSAQAALAEIDAILDNKRIRAPFAGVLGLFQVRLGDYVEAGTPLVTLQDLSQLEVDFSVPDRHAPRLRPGLVMTLRSTAFPGQTFTATLDAVDAKVDEATRNLQLRASIEDGAGLLPGMFARLSIDLASDLTRVMVPETAVTYSLQGDIVYVVEHDDDGAFVVPRVVRTAGSRDGSTAIAEGISDGEQVVIAGQNKLYRGARVAIDPDAVL